MNRIRNNNTFFEEQDVEEGEEQDEEQVKTLSMKKKDGAQDQSAGYGERKRHGGQRQKGRNGRHGATGQGDQGGRGGQRKQRQGGQAMGGRKYSERMGGMPRKKAHMGEQRFTNLRALSAEEETESPSTVKTLSAKRKALSVKVLGNNTHEVTKESFDIMDLVQPQKSLNTADSKSESTTAKPVETSTEKVSETTTEKTLSENTTQQTTEEGQDYDGEEEYEAEDSEY